MYEQFSARTLSNRNERWRLAAPDLDDEMDEYKDDHEHILAKALERLTQMNEANASLTSELVVADTCLASHRAEIQETERLEEENDRLSLQLENARKQIKALKDIVTKSLADIKEEVRHLNKKLEASYTVLDLYQLLYDPEARPAPTPRHDAAPAASRQPDQFVAVEKRLHVVAEEAAWGAQSAQAMPDRPAGPVED